MIRDSEIRMPSPDDAFFRDFEDFLRPERLSSEFSDLRRRELPEDFEEPRSRSEDEDSLWRLERSSRLLRELRCPFSERLEIERSPSSFGLLERLRDEDSEDPSRDRLLLESEDSLERRSLDSLREELRRRARCSSFEFSSELIEEYSLLNHLSEATRDSHQIISAHTGTDDNQNTPQQRRTGIDTDKSIFLRVIVVVLIVMVGGLFRI